ncbi:hypothetical protein OAB13_10275 [Salibacteraceae bacterium]|nr:hypothetical protein [Salibacteraceae bacterium]
MSINQIKSSFFILLLLLTITACKKYPEDNRFTSPAKTNLITKRGWNSVDIRVSSPSSNLYLDDLTEVISESFEFNKNGAFEALRVVDLRSLGSDSVIYERWNGSWEWESKDKERISIFHNDDESTESWEIMRLNKNDFWIISTNPYDDDVWFIEYEAYDL